jgi:ferrochelatase
MQENKKALVLLNMGGARSKDELKMFLTNMFNDRNIITVKNDLIRKMIAYFIVSRRLDGAWENYKHIGNASPINPLTEKLVQKCNEKIEDYKVYQAMRYTPPFAKDVIEEIKKDGIINILLLPLYPQFSTTTTKSSVQDFIDYTPYSCKLEYIEEFYQNEKFNECIINEIISNVEDASQYNLIWLHMEVIKKFELQSSNPTIFLTKLENFNNRFLTNFNFTPKYKKELDKIKMSIKKERKYNYDNNKSGFILIT